MRSAKTVFFGRDRDFSRLIEIFVIISDFCGFLDFFLDLDREILDFYKYLDRDFSSQPYLFTFCASKLASKLAKSEGNSNFFQKVSTKISIYLEIILINCKNLDLSWKSRLVSTISIKISTHLYLDWKVSILKISTEIKWKLISIVEKISTSFKNWSRRKGRSRSRSRSRLVSTSRPPTLIQMFLPF